VERKRHDSPPRSEHNTHPALPQPPVVKAPKPISPLQRGPSASEGFPHCINASPRARIPSALARARASFSAIGSHEERTRGSKAKCAPHQPCCENKEQDTHPHGSGHDGVFVEFINKPQAAKHPGRHHSEQHEPDECHDSRCSRGRARKQRAGRHLRQPDRDTHEKPARQSPSGHEQPPLNRGPDPTAALAHSAAIASCIASINCSMSKGLNSTPDMPSWLARTIEWCGS
jgi:hypothetical protein